MPEQDANRAGVQSTVKKPAPRFNAWLVHDVIDDVINDIIDDVIDDVINESMNGVHGDVVKAVIGSA